MAEKKPKEQIDFSNHENRRPYKMMHEGRNIYEEWFNALIAEYDARRKEGPVDITCLVELINATRQLEEDLKTLNTDKVQAQTLENHMNFLDTYTSAAHWSGSSGLDSHSVMRHTNDSIRFFVHLPVVAALDALKHSNLKLAETEIVREVQAALNNDSYIACMEDFAKTGFAVLTEDFALGLRLSDFGRQKRRGILHAASDSEIIMVERREDQKLTYRLDDWVRDYLVDALAEQNVRWGKGILKTGCGNLEHVPSPISSGCPVRTISIDPLCRFMSRELGNPELQPQPCHERVESLAAIALSA